MSLAEKMRGDTQEAALVMEASLECQDIIILEMMKNSKCWQEETDSKMLSVSHLREAQADSWQEKICTLLFNSASPQILKMMMMNW